MRKIGKRKFSVWKLFYFFLNNLIESKVLEVELTDPSNLVSSVCNILTHY
jgi:hypothetical protein